MNLDYLFTSLNIPNDNYLVVGVSAGPDSMALLHLMKRNLKNPIVCAHINHNIRKNSQQEEEYLKQYCKDNNIYFESTKITKWEKNNFEEEARIKRYTFYEKVLKKYHSHSLFLAHHGDDLIETVLMKIIRGSNLEGYAGIKTYNKLENYTIIRPLLKITKEDILKYNHENHIKYFIDSTNSKTIYTRNRIRKNILPLLKKEDKNIHIKFLKYSNTLNEYHNYINNITSKKIDNIFKNNIINIEKLNKEDPFIKKNIIYKILNIIYHNKSNIIKESHVNSIINLTISKKPNMSISLPKNYCAIKKYQYIHIEKNNKLLENNNYYFELNDKVEISDIIIEKISNTNNNGNDICRLSSNNISMPLYIRNKKDGDYIQVLGLNGKKKVSDIFIEEKIPKDDRLKYPLLVDAKDNVLWIPFIKKSKYNVKKEEICDIILTSYKKGGIEIEEKRK